MAHYNVETPRIFTDIGLYAKTNGFLDTTSSTPGYFNLDPTITKSIPWFYAPYFSEAVKLRFIEGYEPLTTGIQAVFFLGCKAKTFSPIVPDASEIIWGGSVGIAHNLGLMDFGWAYMASSNFSAYSLTTVNGILEPNGIDVKGLGDGPWNQGEIQLNEVSTCCMYEFQHAAEFNMTMTQSNESINTVETKSGKTFVNQGWSSPPMWGELAPWQNTSPYNDPTPHNAVKNKPGLGNTFRRSWNLNFSYLDKNVTSKGLWPSNYTNKFGFFDVVERRGEVTYNGILDDFTNKVINLTNGFALPVIFQPDKNYHEFAICKIESESFSATCVSPGFFDVQLTLREIW